MARIANHLNALRRFKVVEIGDYDRDSVVIDGQRSGRRQQSREHNQEQDPARAKPPAAGRIIGSRMIPPGGVLRRSLLIVEINFRLILALLV
jgi:hypothetical protein